MPHPLYSVKIPEPSQYVDIPNARVVKGADLLGYPEIFILDEAAFGESRPFEKGGFFLWNGWLLSPKAVFSKPDVNSFPACGRTENKYIFAMQRLLYVKGERDTFVIIGAEPARYQNGRIALPDKPDSVNGLAWVAHVKVPVNFKDYFKTPEEVERFISDKPAIGETTTSSGKLARELFESLFRESLEDIGKQVEEGRKMPVRGVLLSPIKPNLRTNLSPSIYAPGLYPKGDFAVAASYLV